MKGGELDIQNVLCFLVNKLKLLKRNALINVYTSMTWYISDNIIKISTDLGKYVQYLQLITQKFY